MTDSGLEGPSKTALPRVVYVPNERGGDQGQVDVRRALRDLERAGLIEHTVFSLLAKVKAAGSKREASRERQNLIGTVRQFGPTHVLMQHLGGTGLQAEHMSELRESGNFSLIYHEADPYTRWKHPLPPEAKVAARAADVVFTVGTGVFLQNFKRLGAQDVRWVPSIYSPGVFGSASLGASTRSFDVVMIANRNVPRFRGLPHWRERIAFVDYMMERYGTRFAIFGKGWDGPSAKGPTPYVAQGDALRSGWVSANWDHFRTEPDYFSDRLPIAMACGSLHATSDHPGYNELFSQTESFLIRGWTFEALADQIDDLLKFTTASERIEREFRAQQYADGHFRQDDQVVTMLNAQATVIDPQSARSSWSTKQ